MLGALAGRLSAPERDAVLGEAFVAACAIAPRLGARRRWWNSAGRKHQHPQPQRTAKFVAAYGDRAIRAIGDARGSRLAQGLGRIRGRLPRCARSSMTPPRRRRDALSPRTHSPTSGSSSRRAARMCSRRRRPSARSHHWNRVRAAAGIGNVDLYTCTRHYFAWYAWNACGLSLRSSPTTSGIRTVGSWAAGSTGTSTPRSREHECARRSRLTASRRQCASSRLPNILRDHAGRRARTSLALRRSQGPLLSVNRCDVRAREETREPFVVAIRVPDPMEIARRATSIKVASSSSRARYVAGRRPPSSLGTVTASPSRSWAIGRS